MTQAVLEGVAFAIRDCVEIARDQGAPHKVISPVGMGKGVQGVMPVHPKGIAGNEHRTGGPGS